MENRVDSQKKIWIAYVTVFLITACICLLRLFTSVEMKLVTDNIGCMFVPSYIAGRDWSDMISWISYYGWLYYVIYTPIFFLTNNPYVIYYTICIGNVLVLCALSVLIFHCIVKYFKVENSILAIAMAVLCTTYAIVVPSNFSNELPALFMVWIIVYLLLKLNQYVDSLKKKNIFTVVLLITLMCSINIHTRLVMIWMVLFFVFLLVYCIYKKWLVNPWIFTFGSIVVYLGGIGLKNIVVNFVWQAGGLSEVKNTTLNVVEYVKKVDTSIKVIIDIIISNFYKLNMQTYGIAIIVLIIVLFFIGNRLVSLITRRKNKVDNNEEQNNTERGIFLVSLVFLISLIGTICALPLYYGSGVAAGYEMGVENARFSAFTYLRYYFQYFGPVFVCAIILLGKKNEYDNRKSFISVFAYVLISLCVVSCVLPHLSAYYQNFIIQNFLTDDTYRINFVISVAIILLLMILWNILIKKNRVQVIVWILLILYVSSYGKNISSPFMNITLPAAGNSAYQVLSVADDDIELPREIYSMKQKGIQIALQVLLNDYQVKLSEPTSDIDEAIAVTKTYDSTGTDALLRQGYRYWILDEDECLWVKGENLQERLEPYISQYITEEKEVNDINIEYGEKTIKVFNTIFQPSDGISAISTIAKPIPGEYKMCISMDTVHVPTESFGTVEVLLDGEVVTTESIVVDGMNEGTLCISVYVGDIDECQISCSFLKNTIIKNLTITTQCMNPNWIVGMEYSEELEELENVMEASGVSLPVKIMGYNNPYSGQVDWSVLEDVFHVEQIEVIDSDLAMDGKINKNCYLILQNSNENQLIFDLVENYNILWKTQHFTLLMYDNEWNRKALEENNCMMLSQDGAINVNYFRLDENGNLVNDRTVDLPKGAYQITEYYSHNIMPQQRDMLVITRCQEKTGTLLSVYQASVVEVEDADMYVGKQTISVNDGELYSFNWNHNALAAEAVSQAYISSCKIVYEVGDIIDFSTAGERPFYYSGIGGAEEWGAWSTELDSIIELDIKCKDSITLDITMNSYIAQDVTIYANGTKITVLSVGESLDTYSIVIPKEYLDGGKLELTLSVEQLCSPNERTGSPDMRTLGIGIKQIKLK